VHEGWPIRTQFDAIFCRNVTIYFDKPGQRSMLQRLVQFLRPGGLLFWDIPSRCSVFRRASSTSQFRLPKPGASH